jgi:hypothetical protein
MRIIMTTPDVINARIDATDYETYNPESNLSWNSSLIEILTS